MSLRKRNSMASEEAIPRVSKTMAKLVNISKNLKQGAVSLPEPAEVGTGYGSAPSLSTDLAGK